MIDRIMKRSGEKAYYRDIKRLDLTRLDPSVEEFTDIGYIDDGFNEHTLDVYCRKDGTMKPVLIDLHGGGFISHDKNITGFTAIIWHHRDSLYSASTTGWRIRNLMFSIRWKMLTVL